MINTNAPLASYTGNNTTDTFTFTFKVRDAADVIIAEWDVVTGSVLWTERGDDLVNVDTFTFDANNGGGTVVLAAGNLAVDRKLIILLQPENPVQTFKFREQGDFNLRQFENGLDAALIYIQALREELSRSFRLGTASKFNPDINTLIDSVPPANGIPIFDGSGEVLGWTSPAEIAAQAAGGLPTGQVDGQVLGVGTGDVVEWKDYAYSGYSARFSESINTTNLDDTLSTILNLSYLAPQISLSGSGSGTIREKGTSLASAALTATITKRSDPIAAVRFYRGVTLLDTQTSGGAIPNGGTSNYTDSTGWTDTISFSAQVDDDGSTGGPTTVTSNTVTYTFVYPYYYGAAAAGRTAAQVAALTKDVIVSTATVNKTITATAGQVFYFAYPASYGALTSILDVNGFNTIADWTLRTENITGADATAQSYRIYEFNNPVTAGDYYYSFRR